MRVLTTIIAFAGKEIRQVLRQPRLMAALLLGPFVILGLFAAGFQADPAALRTTLVIPEDSPLNEEVTRLQDSLGPNVEVVSVLPDEDTARQSLSEREIDAVVVTPSNIEESILNDESAVIRVVHDRLDPLERDTIGLAAQAAVDELNRIVLADVVSEATSRTEEVGDSLDRARQATSSLADAVDSGDQAGAEAAAADVDQELTRIETAVDSAAGLDDATRTAARGSIDEARQLLEAGHTNPESLEELDGTLAELDESVGAVENVSPETLVQPFTVKTEAVTGISIPYTAYYTPAVAVVLLQHVVLTFAALSMVSERTTGTTELFRASPVKPGLMLIGKFLGYATLGVVVSTVLVLGIVYVFGAPMAGSWGWLAVVMLLVLAASLGLGFLLAATAQTGAQAVQYAMLVLLFTIFFSGFVIPISRLVEGVRYLALLVPATAGTASLQGVMFRGAAPSGSFIALLGIYAVVTVFIAGWSLRRQNVA